MRKHRKGEEPERRPEERDNELVLFDEDDALIRFVAELASGNLDVDDPTNDRYWAWRAREARARQTPEERAATAARADAFARRWAVRHLGETLKVALARGAPEIETGRNSLPFGLSLGESLRFGRRQGRMPLVDARPAAGSGRAIWDEPSEGWIAQPAGLPVGEYVALRVAGDSMTPLLHDGDTIVLRPGGSVQINTVVVARLPDDGHVVKKVARVDADWLELASLNEAYAPRTVRRDQAAVIGTVVMRWCAHGP